MSFLASLMVMAAIPLRHKTRLSEIKSEEAASLIDPSAPTSSVIRAPLVTLLKRIEAWYHESATHAFLKLADIVLKFFERSAGKIAGEIKDRRMLVQERFRVIPRESPYWKQIQTWKRVDTGSARLATVNYEGEDEDASNHSFLSL